MRYDYECTSCAAVQEVVCRMDERPSVLRCPSCGSEARQVILSVPESFVRFRPYEFNKRTNVQSWGRTQGRTDEKQHDEYRKAFELQRTLVKQRRRTPKIRSDEEFEYLGGMPGEMVESINNAEGKEAVQKDPVTFLKKNDLYMGS